MRSSRLFALPFLLLSLAACKKAPPTERFIAPDVAMAVVFPSLDSFARQTADVLDTAATFPGGQQIDDFRAVAKSRVGFDLFDAKSMAQAGVDPKRGMAVGLRSPTDREDAVVVFPVADEKKFGETADTLAKKGLGLEVRSEEKGVVTWAKKDEDVSFAYALTEKSALFALGDGAVDRIRWALAVPKDGHLGTQAGYKASIEAVGVGQALVFYTPANAEMAQVSPHLKMGFAIGLSGARDRVALAIGVPLEEGSPLLKGEKVDAGPLVAKLDPGAAWVARSDVDMSSSIDEEKKAALEVVALVSPDPQTKALVSDAFDALGGAAAFGAGVVPSPAPDASIQRGPLGLFRVELLLGLRDQAKMKGVLQALAAKADPGLVEAKSPDGPWVMKKAGGEVGVAVEPTRLLLAVGPTGALQALTARDDSKFQPPTEAAKKAFQSSLAGMFVDVPKLLGNIKALPVSAYGEGEGAARSQVFVQQGLESFGRVKAVSGSSERKGKAVRAELVIEVAPAQTK